MSTIRIGDLERDAAAMELGEHFAQGRLTADEHAERLDAVWAAKTEADLRPIFRDLPGSAYAPRPLSPFATSRPARGGSVDSRRRSRRRFPLMPVIVILAIITIVTRSELIVFGLLAFALYKAQPWRRHGSGRC